MKRFYFISAAILSASLLAGCSTTRGDGGRTAPGQQAGTVVPGQYGQGTGGTKAIQMEATLPGIVAEHVRLGNETIGGLTGAELAEKLSAAAAKLDRDAIDASIDPATWRVTYGKSGKRLDVGKMITAALSAGKDTTVPYSWQTVQPKVTSVQIRNEIKRIAKFTTPFLDKSKSRINNIRLVSSKLNRKIVQPGQEFSFNAATGSKSSKYGYKKATVIVRTPKGPVHKKAVGGGVCQVSTTLFNAVQQGGLKVTERHEHSDDVYYVPEGKDATVMYGGADFKFVNNRENPIMIKVYVGKTSLLVSIYEYTGFSRHKG